ncbi:hypothetical protein N0V88_001741 [Collariella sp. IMI 366227]|nr:hypothetical protein N0V88_001741 [Collariella sp. IMI 366227]
MDDPGDIIADRIALVFFFRPADLAGSSWDTTAEGTQNFHDAAGYYAGEAEDFVLPFGHNTPRPDTMDATDDFQARWTSAAAAEKKALKAEPMRRGTSRSSTASHKTRSMKPSAAAMKKTRSRVQSMLSQTSSQLSKLDMTGNVSSADAQGRILDVQQYLAQNLDTLSVSPQVNDPAFYSGLVGFADGLPYCGDYGAAMAQHVNPQIFGTGLIAASPHSWGSLSPAESRLSSPGLQDGSDGVWSAAQMTRKLDGSSQYATSAEDLQSNYIPAVGEDGFALPHSAFGSRRLSGEAREKLKCNYDKFVDSHLKPYRCRVEGCQNTRFSSTACLLRHEREAHAMHGHGEKPYLCTYEGCERAIPGHGFPRQWNLRDHMKRVHNDSGVPVQPASPPPTGVTTSSRGRKRKSNSQEKQPAQEKPSSRKSNKAVPEPAAPKQPEVVTHPELDQWYEHQKALQVFLQGCVQPDDPQTIQYIKDAQHHLNAMGKISNGLIQTSYRTWG